jgi:hypothetical protein
MIRLWNDVRLQVKLAALVSIRHRFPYSAVKPIKGGNVRGAELATTLPLTTRLAQLYAENVTLRSGRITDQLYTSSLG